MRHHSHHQVSGFLPPYDIGITPYQATDVDPEVHKKKLLFQDKDSNVKVVFCGEMGVGKTSIINKFCHNTFNRDYKGTIGVDFEVELMSVLGCPMKLQIWDTAGQERFRSIASSYFRGANVVVAVVDLSDVLTFAAAHRWMEEAVQNCQYPLRFLVGNKRDLLADTNYPEVESRVMALATELNAEYWPCSAKTGYNVAEFFPRMAFLAMERVILSSITSSNVGSAGEQHVTLHNPAGVSTSQSVKKTTTCSACGWT